MSGPAPGERIYPCAKCGVMRSKLEGGQVFTVCDECWHYSPEGSRWLPLSLREGLEPVEAWYRRSTECIRSLQEQLFEAHAERDTLRSALKQAVDTMEECVTACGGDCPICRAHRAALAKAREVLGDE